MQQVITTFSLVLLSIFAEAQTPLVSTYNPCQSIENSQERYKKALEKLSTGERSKAVKAAQSCANEDEEFDPEDNEFSCSDINDSCPMLSAAPEDTLKSLKDDAKKERKELQDDMDDKLKDQADQKKEAATLAKEYAEKENDVMEQIESAEEEYQRTLDEKDKEALEQVQQIQSKISELTRLNTQIVKQANRALAELQAAKLNARKSCREQARKDYQAILQQLDAELAKRGGKVAGGFEGIANAEKYRRFLQSKIRNPEPSGNFTLCFSVGDATETDLQQRNMGTALTMDEFATQIENNNKQRDELIQQLKQQQELAQTQKIKGYQQHQKKLMGLQRKIMMNRQNFERESRALAEQTRQLETQLTRLQEQLGKAIRAESNAEDRYNCLTSRGLALKGTDFTSGREIYSAIALGRQSLVNSCRNNTQCNHVCGDFQDDATGNANPGVINAPTASPSPASRGTRLGTGTQ